MASRRAGWLDRWIQRRLTPAPLPWTLPRRRIYILPTRFGLGFAVMTLIMLLGAMNYSNSMAFGLTFLMASIGLVAMHHTHSQLVGLMLVEFGAAPAHVGDEVIWKARLAAASGPARLGITLTIDEALNPAEGDGQTVDRPTRFELRQPASTRGWQAAPVLCVATIAPLGLFRAWSYVLPEVRALVYPRLAAAGTPPPPPEMAQEDDDSVAARVGQSQYAGLRVYQRGEHLNRIHWKSLPKTIVPMVKQFEDSEPPEGWLDLDQTPGGDLEARLSQLARWVVDLEAQGSRYGLRLGDRQVPIALGGAHQHACLQALALYGSAG